MLYLNNIKSYIQKNSTKISSFFMASKLLSVALLFAFVPFKYQPEKRETYETEIKLNTQSPQALTLPEKKVESYSAGSREDLASADPEAIKGLMKFYGEKYGVDWKLVYAIGYHESGNYTSSLARRQNNYFGRKASSGGYASWSTPEEGIENQFVYLKTRYFDRGMDTPAEINPVYAEDMSWHYAVESVMASI